MTKIILLKLPHCVKFTAFSKPDFSKKCIEENDFNLQQGWANVFEMGPDLTI